MRRCEKRQEKMISIWNGFVTIMLFVLGVTSFVGFLWVGGGMVKEFQDNPYGDDNDLLAHFDSMESCKHSYGGFLNVHSCQERSPTFRMFQYLLFIIVWIIATIGLGLRIRVAYIK